MILWKSALPWAFALLAVALASRLGWIEQHVTTTLLIVMPVLAVTFMLRRSSCCPRSA